MARRAKGAEMGALKTFSLYFPHSDALTSALSVHNDGTYAAWISDPRLSAPGFRDRKLSGLYQSFTYVFDVYLALGCSARKWYARCLSTSSRCSRNHFSVFLSVDVSGLYDFRLS